MIKTTLGHLLNAIGYFPNPQGAAFGRLTQLQLPAGQALKVVKLGFAIDKEVDAFRKVHQALPTEDIPPGDPQHNPNAEGEQKRLTPEAVAELNALLSEPVTLQAEKLKIEAMAHAPITSADLFALAFIFDGLEDETSKPNEPAKAKPKGNGKLKAVPATA